MFKWTKWLTLVSLIIGLGTGAITSTAVTTTPITVMAVGHGSSGGGHVGGGHATAHATAEHAATTHAANPGSRFGATSHTSDITNHAALNPGSRFKAGGTSGFTKSFTDNPATRARVYSSPANNTLSTTRMQLSDHNKSYQHYFKTPYSNDYYTHNHYMNLWFYSWLWSQHLTAEQQNILAVQGIDHAQVLKNAANTHRITIDDHGTEKVIVVTEHQYDQIHVGDKVRLYDGVLTVNGKELAK